MIRVTQHRLGMHVLNLLRCHGLNGRFRTDDDKGRRLDLAMRRTNHARPRQAAWQFGTNRKRKLRAHQL
jgi:hypothetical protein